MAEHEQNAITENGRPETETETHPTLINHLILETIFSYLDHEELKTVRQVCRIWSMVGKPILNQQSIVHLDDYDKITDYCDYIYYFGSSASECIPNIKIMDINFTPQRIQCLDLLLNQRIFTSCLVSLEIDFAPNCTKAILSDLLSIGTFANLQKMKIRLLKFFPDNDSFEGDFETDATDEAPNANFSLDWNLCHFPKLKSFSCIYFSFDGSEFIWPTEFLNLLQQFRNVKDVVLTGTSTRDLSRIFDMMLESKKLSGNYTFPINSLEIFAQDALTGDHLQKITQLDFPLSRLTLEIGSRLDEIAVQTMFQHYRYTLEEIQVRKYPAAILHQLENTLPSPIFLQEYPIVHDLDIVDGFMPSLDFLNYCPSLQTLKISHRNPSKLATTNMIQATNLFYFPHLQLQSLTIDENLSLNCLYKLSAAFPNLLHLKCRVDDEMLRIVFQHMRLLKSLSIIAKISDECSSVGNKMTCTDRGITGVPMRYMEWGGFNVTKRRLFPCIGDLKDLESLTIESWGTFGGGITDLSIFYGILECKKLKRAHFIRTLITSEGLDALNSIGVRATEARSS